MPWEREDLQRRTLAGRVPGDRPRGRATGAPRPGAAQQVGSAPRPLSPAGVLQLQRVVGNGATAGLVTGDHGVTVQRDYSPEEIAAITRLQALVRARRVRAQVRVRQEAPGIVGVRVRNSDPRALGDISGTPLAAVRQHLRDDTEYNQLRVLGGATQGAVVGPGTGEGGKLAGALATGLPQGTAVINGGYFAHTEKILSEENWSGPRVDEQTQDATTEDPEVAKYLAYVKADEKSNQLSPVGSTGRPVGETSHRSDPLPIPSEYAEHYGQVNVGGRVGLSSGPVLTHQGVPRHFPDDDRFAYRLRLGDDVLDNPRNRQAGALTHVGDPNARAAVSTQGRDVLMHTVVDPRMRPGDGVTMAQWQTMTMMGAGGHVAGRPPLSTLNLDGGGSVYMGITGPGGVRVVAKGQRPSEKVERPVGNIIASLPTVGAQEQPVPVTADDDRPAEGSAVVGQ
ncbi:phosphodiester glycosidase family protein [Cellulosimicrobium arenosum]|uniref:Phosphodiester glycosidase family protein n=1 Tax=Cellulosimicrobium arenosum TaxID=2708133 RepID=A0A927G6E9_9MICO|nr:phosphodiester glycosidase family protein [Cellulosimicrobium arenosum]MBD8077747.1 phosphodiester glycosidase family protein [Cellulosimicrobium arenosum]